MLNAHSMVKNIFVNLDQQLATNITTNFIKDNIYIYLLTMTL